MHTAFTASARHCIEIHLFTGETWSASENELSDAERAFAVSQTFKAKAGQTVILPDAQGAMRKVIFGLGDGGDALAVAALSARLPEGDYEIKGAPEDWPLDWSAAGWADGAYRFSRYLKKNSSPPRLLVPAGKTGQALSQEAEAVTLARDLINTPASDMGPDRMEAVIQDLAAAHGASVTVIRGDDLLDQNYPLVHAVGRAADTVPRFIELDWDKQGDPELALVGKGVAFDSGGLNIKTGDFMRIMKKDMGGAAHAIALASLVMTEKLPVHLKLYIPAVENAISGNAFRPGDILPSRKGLMVEIDNTDAEGRLILADALTRASESRPDLILDFATLTGAARIALGPDLAPFYCDDDELADALTAAAASAGDPVWRMPLWMPYVEELKSPIADLVNSGGRMAGSITAALFLKQFLDQERWLHFDVWGWRNRRYGRPAGAAACGLRTSWEMLKARYG